MMIMDLYLISVVRNQNPNKILIYFNITKRKKAYMKFKSIQFPRKVSSFSGENTGKLGERDCARESQRERELYKICAITERGCERERERD